MHIQGFSMYHHVKKLVYTVRVDEPDPRFGNMLLEQFGGANGEMAAAMQYSIQGLNCDDPARKDLLKDNLEIRGDACPYGAAQKVEQTRARSVGVSAAMAQGALTESADIAVSITGVPVS